MNSDIKRVFLFLLAFAFLFFATNCPQIRKSSSQEVVTPLTPQDPSTPQEGDDTEPSTPSNPGQTQGGEQGSESSEGAQGGNDNPSTPTTPSNPDNPATPQEPENPETPSSPSTPDNPENPVNPSTPSTPDNPNNPNNPDNPENPTPQDPINPSVPEPATEPETEIPDIPEIPKTSDNPSASELQERYVEFIFDNTGAVNALKAWDGKIEYSLDKQSWTEWTGGDIAVRNPETQTGQVTLYLRGSGNTTITGANPSAWDTEEDVGSPWSIIVEGMISYDETRAPNTVKIKGDIRNLLNYKDYSKIRIKDGCFSNWFNLGKGKLNPIKDVSELVLITPCVKAMYKGMFKNCVYLTSSPRLNFDKLTAFCYCSMFEGCLSLTSPPSLPALEQAESSYSCMFKDCENLRTSPALPSSTLAKSCYSSMFENCKKITTAPSLSSTPAEDCYYKMFMGCSSLLATPELPSVSLAPYCYERMFDGCTSITQTPLLKATNLEKNCYHAMFANCTSLEKISILPALNLADTCYWEMFSGCEKIKISRAKSAEYSNLFVLGTKSAKNSYKDMFKGTGGEFSDTPDAENVYYTSNEVLYFGTPKSIEIIPSNLELEIGDKKAFRAIVRPFGSNPNVYYTASDEEIIDINEEGLLVAKSQGNARVIATSVSETNITGYADVSVKASGVVKALCFSSETEFSITAKSGKTWDGELEYAVNYPTHLWQKWNGEKIESSFNTGLSKHTLYLRGIGNTKITGDKDKISENSWQIDGNNVEIEGDINYLLQYTDPQNAQMDNFCYLALFLNNTSIISAPSITSLQTLPGCYAGMFEGCANLVNPPSLPALVAKGKMACDYGGCYEKMFANCSSLSSPPAISAQEFEAMSCASMFENCTSLTATPCINPTKVGGGIEIPGAFEKMFAGCTSLSDASDFGVCAAIRSHFGAFSNCSSLITPPSLPSTSIYYLCYASMFENCSSLTYSPSLPATTLAIECYQGMFKGCTSLLTPPELNSLTMAPYAYEGMFEDCKSLRSLPSLPATTLAQYCYKDMFQNCESLTNIPEDYLPCLTMQDGCYFSMFNGCKNITTSPSLPSLSLAPKCYNLMFSQTAISTPPSLPATTLKDECYSCMFASCENLASLPSLPATTLANECYLGMFNDCPLIKVSDTQDEEYTTSYPLASGDAEGALDFMFFLTGGKFAGQKDLSLEPDPDNPFSQFIPDDPAPGTILYTSNPVV